MSIDYTNSFTSYTNVLSCSSGTDLFRAWITESDGYYAKTAVWALRLEVILATTSASDATVTPFSGPTSTGSFEANSSTPTSSPNRKPRLGTGPIVGIVVGVVGALLLAGALFFFLRRRQNQHHHTPIPKVSAGGENDALPEYVGGHGTTTAPTQMTAASSNGLFQPQPEVRASR
jgi:LPXTG-motif cell wall-anchored protein